MELTKEFNVLEAYLWNSISLNKGNCYFSLNHLHRIESHWIVGLILFFSFSGCYKGQETISRLITYDGLKQRLWGIHLSDAAEPGNIITLDGKKVPKISSYKHSFYLFFEKPCAYS